jgi:CRP-like cAMP-binding protein
MKGAIELILNEPESAIQIALGEQELYSVPADVWREIRAVGDEPAEIILTVSGDHRKRIVWPQELVQEAQAAGYALDPNGYIAKKDMLPDTALNVGVCR